MTMMVELPVFVSKVLSIIIFGLFDMFDTGPGCGNDVYSYGK